MHITPELISSIAAVITGVGGIFGGAAWQKGKHKTKTSRATAMNKSPCRDHLEVCTKLDGIPEIKESLKEFREELKSYYRDMRADFDQAFTLIRQQAERISRLEGIQEGKHS